MEKAADIPKPRRGRFHHGDLRNALLEAATRAVAEGGVEALSIRALAQELGVFHRAAYRHYADKSDLLAAVLTQGYQRLATRIRDRLVSRESGARFREIALGYAAFAFDEPQIFFALCGPRLNEAGMYPELEAAVRAAVAPTLETIKAAQRANVLPPLDPEAAAIFFWASLQGIVTQVLHKRLKLRPTLREKFIEQTADRLFAGLQLDLTTHA